MSRPDPKVLKKAVDYRRRAAADPAVDELEAQRQAERPRIESEQDFQDLVGRRIEEAMRNGAFENLRGKGKPLNLQRNPFVPEEMEMAYSIMAQNNISPEWIGDRAEILRRINAFRERLRALVGEHQHQLKQNNDPVARANTAQQWHGHLRQLEAQVVELNRQIGIVNLKQPIVRLEIFKLRLDEELARAGLNPM
jgi:DnaJ homolog subfamily C member 28